MHEMSDDAHWHAGVDRCAAPRVSTESVDA
jgi:hypothetical protein